MLALRRPAAVGANCTCTMQPFDASSVVPVHWSRLTRKSAASRPRTSIERMVWRVKAMLNTPYDTGSDTAPTSMSPASLPAGVGASAGSPPKPCSMLEIAAAP